MKLRYIFYHCIAILVFFITCNAVKASNKAASIFNYVSCPRSLAIEQTCENIFPLELIRHIRGYDGFFLEGKIEPKSRIAACVLMQSNRMMLADTTGKISILDYVAKNIIQEVETHQKGIEELYYASFGENPEQERIVSLAPFSNSFKLLNGFGKSIHARISNYVCYPSLFKLVSFDAFTVSSTMPIKPLDRRILEGLGNPFRIQRPACRQVLYAPGGVFLGFRSGKLEYRKYSMESSNMRWINKPLKEIGYLEKPNPVTALALFNKKLLFAGFADGTIELHDLQDVFKNLLDNQLKDTLQKKWQAHVSSVKDIKVFNKDIILTISGKNLFMWRWPSCEKESEEEFPSDILTVLTTDNERANNYMIICFAQDPMQIRTC